jgi:transcriptional regulator with XRE-family HTH domain
MGSAEAIRRARERTGRSEAELAAEIGITLEWYADLERYDDEFETTITVHQARQLATLLNTSMLELLGHPFPAASPASPTLRALVRERASDEVSLRALEERVGWELEPLMDDSQDFDSLVPITAYVQIAAALGVDWRQLLAAGSPAGGH